MVHATLLAWSFAMGMKEPVVVERAPVVAPALETVEENIIYHTNQQRMRRGLAPLALEWSLMNSARRHTAWMARNQSMTHTRGNVAENIAMGQRSSREAVNSWMNSPGHRANMLNSGYTRVGAAAYFAADGSIYWCVQFL